MGGGTHAQGRPLRSPGAVMLPRKEGLMYFRLRLAPCDRHTAGDARKLSEEIIEQYYICTLNTKQVTATSRMQGIIVVDYMMVFD